MKQITFWLVAVATVAVAVAFTARASRHTVQETTPIFVTQIPAGYRDWRLISVAHEEGDLNDIRAILGNDEAIKAYRAAKLPFPEGTIIARIAWHHVPSEENNKAFGRAQSFVAGDAPPWYLQFMVKGSKKYAATGGWGYAQFDKDGKPVNRELELLRTIFSFAEQSDWVAKSPFKKGASLISKASERQRDRVLTLDEEARLLAACSGRRAHLRPLVMTALDTGMRRGELLKLVWPDVDFTLDLIRVRATNTKTERPRNIGMTLRVREALLALREVAPPNYEGLVFGIKDTVKNGFRKARRIHWPIWRERIAGAGALGSVRPSLIAQCNEDARMKS